MLAGINYLRDKDSSTNNIFNTKKAKQVAFNSGNAKSSDFDKTRFSIDSASSPWAIVNKGRSLPDSYVPSNLTIPKVNLRLASGSTEMMLRQDAAEALEKLFNDAASQGINLKLTSGYRSFKEQASLNRYYVNTQGQAVADATSARAGHSEHQTGLAADVEPQSGKCELDKCFGATAEGLWLASNSQNYGFIIRYPANKTSQTGYDYEPWHLRYVGSYLALSVHERGLSLEEFFGLPFYTNYPITSFQLN